MCSRFQGDSGREIIQTTELTGPIGRLTEESFRLASGWLAKDYKLKGARLQGQIAVPSDALREAILNALVHRKYSIHGAVKIAIYDNHLEIFSPGSFPGMVDLESLGDGTTYLRNPHVARIAHKMGEKLGTGVRLIFDSCREAGLKRPIYHEGADSVKVTFSFEHDRSAHGLTDESAIESLVRTRSVSVQDVMSLLSVSRNTATRKLNVLIGEGKLVRVGKGPAVRFRKTS